MKKKTIEEKEKEKEKKILQLMKYDLKNKIKDLSEKNVINSIRKVSKTNLDLVHIDIDRKYSLSGKQDQEQEKEPIIKRRNVKTLSIHITKSPEKYQTMMNNPDEILKTKIFRVVGKKINNFSQIFEDKNNTIIDLFQKFRSKISEIRDQFNCYSNSVELNTNKLKNPIKFINFNEVIIFERKVIEYLEKRILFYMKVINNIESIFIDDNINFKSLNAFYSSIEKEITILKSTKSNDFSVNNDKENNISSHKSIKEPNNGNLNSNRHNEKYNDLQTDQNILNTERNNRVDNKYNKLFLPSLKRMSQNNNQLLNRSTFRNSQLKLNSLSKDKQNKHDIFNVQKPAFLESIKKNKDEQQHILNLKESKKSVDKYKIMVDHNNKENIHAHVPNKAIKKISKKNVKIVEHDKDRDKKDTKRRKSVAILTVPNYHNLNNVNDYIMNYNNNHVPTDKHKNDEDKQRKEDIRHRTRKNYQSSKNAVIKKESKKLNIFNNIKSVEKKPKNIKVNKKESKKSQISCISKKSINKSIKSIKSVKSITTNSEKTKKEIVNEDNNDDNFSSESSESDNEDDKEEEDKKSTINDKKEEEEINETSIDNKDPLDDIKYLQKLRNKIKKENYHEIEFLLSEKK